MSTYGRQVQETTGRPFSIVAAGDAEWKHGGITIDWDTVDAVSDTPATLDDGSTVAVGDKYLPAGTVVDLITASKKYGPADTALVSDDGRKVLARGETYLLAEAAVMSKLGSDHPAVLEGGTVFEARLKAGATVAGATQPALAAILTALPRLRLVKETN